MLNKSLNLIPINDSFYLSFAFPKIKDIYLKGSNIIDYMRFEVTIDIDITGAFSNTNQVYRLNFFIDMEFNKNISEYKIDSISMIKLK